MRTIETIREFKTRHFTVRVLAVEDPDIDLSFDDDGSVARKLESGELMGFGVTVDVYCNGAEVGSDAIFGCIYKSPSDFMDHFGIARMRRDEGRKYGSYFSDMIHAAIGEARKTLDCFRKIQVRNN